jgi:plasmid stabilization system protein ParE
MDVVVRPAAAADIEDAYTWYERQRSGLGDAFLDAVRAAFQSMAGHPLAHPVVHRNTRRVLLRRFPYAAYFRIYGELIVVVACIHSRRDPRRWKARTE